MDILYHYCSTATFYSIISNRSIWLSSLSLSNDSMEGKIVADAVARLSKRDRLDEDASKSIQTALAMYETTIDGLGFCLSKKGDLLSQWRGYAADATGVAIGFSKDYLKWLALPRSDSAGNEFLVAKVVYDAKKQESEVQTTYEEMKKAVESDAFKNLKMVPLADVFKPEIDIHENKKRKENDFLIGLTKATSGLVPKLFSLKSPAFKEEEEWRLVSYLFKEVSDTCSYRVVSGKVVPYREFALGELLRNPVVEVVLGPKQATPRHVIEGFLDRNGFEGVCVRRSAASYR